MSQKTDSTPQRAPHIQCILYTPLAKVTNQPGAELFGTRNYVKYPSKMQYQCHACEHHIRGCEIPKHYKDQTNWEQVDRMRSCVGDEALFQAQKMAEKHALFIFEKNTVKTNFQPGGLMHCGKMCLMMMSQN